MEWKLRYRWRSRGAEWELRYRWRSSGGYITARENITKEVLQIRNSNISYIH